MKQIAFTRDKLKLLKDTYANNINEVSFTVEFDGERVEFLTKYAKYLIEYLDLQFQKGVN